MEELENIELTKEQKDKIVKLVKQDSSQMQLTPRQIVEELDIPIAHFDALAGHFLHHALIAPIDQSADPVRRHVGGQGGSPAAAVTPNDQQRPRLAVGEMEAEGDGGRFRRRS